MNRQEWVGLTAYQPTDEEWEIIQKVYTFHPAIPDVNGKKIIAGMFKLGGMGIITDMLPAADLGLDHDNIIAGIKREIEAQQACLDNAIIAQRKFIANYRPLYSKGDDENGE
jgi:hypothetical protein